MMRTTLLCCFFLLLMGGPGLAQMSGHLKEEFHDAEAYGVKIVETRASLRAALHDETVRILCFQSFDETLDEESALQLMEWVRDGGSLWFYDARLAPLFGMRPVFLSGEEFRSKPEEGVLGGKKRSGLATVAMSLGSHPVQTGVGQVTIFLPEIKKEGEERPVYGAIEAAGDTVALLQYGLGSPALVACRRDGRGFIVFKDLLWNEPLSGDRFQGNLLEFSAGFQVPGPAGVGKVGDPPGPEAEYVEGEPALAVSPGPSEETGAAPVGAPPAVPVEPVEGHGPWVLELKDGTTVHGELQGELLEFETGSSSLKLKPDQVESLEFGSAVKLDRIVTVKGEESAGLLLTSPIRFRTQRGVEEFEKEDLIKLSRSEK